MIKPEFWDDEKLARVSRDSRLLFVGLWTHSDDFGVVKGNHVWLKNKIFPYDEDLSIQVFSSWVNKLESSGFIIGFDTDDEKYYYIVHFDKHQKVDHPSKQRNPEPPKDILSRETREPSRITRVETETESETETETKTVGTPVRDIVGHPGTCPGHSVFSSLGSKSSPKVIRSQKDPDLLPLVSEIVSYLNEKAGKKFTPTGVEAVKNIKGRLAEGHTVDEFKKIIDTKVPKWKGTTQDDYLRPSTLFAPSHFDEYLNERPATELTGVAKTETLDEKRIRINREFDERSKKDHSAVDAYLRGEKCPTK